MSSVPDIKSFQSGLEEASKSLLGVVESAVSSGTWNRAYFDSRSGPDELSSAVGKLRVEMYDGSWNKSVSTPLSVRKFLMATRDSMHDLFQRPWYGIKITVYPDKRVQVDYNYDPKCLGDQGFIDF